MMTLNKIPLDERTEKALRLAAEFNELKERCKAFVGEANCDPYNGDPFHEVREIASKGIIKSTISAIKEEQQP